MIEIEIIPYDSFRWQWVQNIEYVNMRFGVFCMCSVLVPSFFFCFFHTVEHFFSSIRNNLDYNAFEMGIIKTILNRIGIALVWLILIYTVTIAPLFWSLNLTMCCFILI